MNDTVLLHLFAAAVFGIFNAVLLGISAYNVKNNRETGPYSPVIDPGLLPGILLIILIFAILSCFFHTQRYLIPEIVILMIHMFAAVMVYSLLLLALLPILRKRISARGLAAMWLLPNLMILLFWRLSFLELMAEPLLILPVPRLLVWLIPAIWAAGFVGVMVWKILSHRRFRRALLKNAEPASDHDRDLFLETRKILCFWGKDVGRYLRIVRAPAAEVPLTVGLFRKTAVLVLPVRDYSDDELRLIYRHEIVHLLHEDNKAKFTLTFLYAVGWFIPSLWAGLRKAAEDMELCCDELAASGIGENGRKQYANLLLTNSGSAKGFTTCLSASASGLRYRLSRILHPKNRRFGVLAAGLLAALSVLCFGMVGFRMDAGTVRTEIFDQDGGGWRIGKVTPYGMFQERGPGEDREICMAFESALADLELSVVPGAEIRSGKYFGEIDLVRNDDYPLFSSAGPFLRVYENSLIYYPVVIGSGKRQPVCFLFQNPVDLAPLFAQVSPPESDP